MIDYDILLTTILGIVFLMLIGANWFVYSQMKHWQRQADHWFGKYLHEKGRRGQR